MVAITSLTATGSLQVHTGGSAARETVLVAKDDGSRAEQPATVVTLSDRAQQLIAEARAADAVADIFAIANGVAANGEGDGSRQDKTKVLVAHDVASNEGLYIVWSSAR